MINKPHTTSSYISQSDVLNPIRSNSLPRTGNRYSSLTWRWMCKEVNGSSRMRYHST